MKLFNNEIDNNYIEIINDYFNQWQSIKNTEQHKDFFSKMPPTFGMFETSILNQINHFLEIGVKVECNDIILTDFKNEVKNILEDLQIYN